MNAIIYNFPNKNQEEKQLQLFHSYEIEVLLICVNTFSDAYYDVNNMDQIDIDVVIACLKEAKKSWYFSPDFVKIIGDMLNSVESL